MRMEPILASASGECAKIERPLAASEIRGWIRGGGLKSANEDPQPPTRLVGK